MLESIKSWLLTMKIRREMRKSGGGVGSGAAYYWLHHRKEYDAACKSLGWVRLIDL